MANLEAINVRIAEAQQHDKVQTECQSCENLVVETNDLGRKLVECALYKSISTDMLDVREHDKNANRGANEIYYCREADTIKAKTFKRIVEGETAKLKPEKIDKAINKWGLKEIYIRVEGGSVCGNDFVSCGDQLVRAKTVENLNNANESCPIIESFIVQVADPSIDGGTDLVAQDPIIYPSKHL
jgi:hypothetical protein